MKGPGFRYDLDIRRVWECPQCGKRLRYLGHVTSKRCNCNQEGHWMTIVEERVRRTFPKREKIVIPEEEPEETPADESTPPGSPEPVEAGTTTEFVEPVPQPEISPPTEELPPPPAAETQPPPPSAAEAQPSPPPESGTDEPPRRKKRRKRRRRKKNRKDQPPHASGDQQSPGPEPIPEQNPQSDPHNDDFGKNIF